MENFKDKIIIGCLLVGIIMTAFPPQRIQIISIDSKIYSERMEYHFIGGTDNFIGSGLYETSSIAFERLFLQYLILIGSGFAIYFVGKHRYSNKNN